MKQLAIKIWNTKFNALGTIAISILASLTTSLVSEQLISRTPGFTAQSAIPATAMSGPSVLDCETGVYSPVQKQCVSQEIFDAEMQRLFAALGLDTSLYQFPNQK